MACARTWKFADGQALRNLVNHLPYSRYRKIWISAPNAILSGMIFANFVF